MSDDRSRFARAMLRTAVTWGAAWAAAGAALVAVLGLFQPAPGIESLVERVGLSIGAGLMWGVRFGIVGAVMGGVFATVVRLRYRGRRLADLGPARSGVLGAVVGGVGVPLYLQAMNVVSGGPIPWELVLDDGVWAAVFGGVAAAGSILLARRAAASPSGADAGGLGDGGDLDALPVGERPASAIPLRSRSAQH